MTNEWRTIDFYRKPTEILEIFKDELYPFLLESSLNDSSRGRFSFVGFDPFKIFRADGKESLNQLKKEFLAYKDEAATGFTPLEAGIVGFLGYDLGLYAENIAPRKTKDIKTPDCLFGFYDCIITIDHFAKRMYLSSSGLPETSLSLRKHRAEYRIRYIMQKLSLSFEQRTSRPEVGSAAEDQDIVLSSNFTHDAYVKAVQKAQEYIAAGDIYQVNLSQRFHFSLKDFPARATDVYRTLREMSPTCFGGFFDARDFQIISSSPERFLLMQNGLVQTRPMKGTRPRGKTPVEDAALKDDILQSAKEKAELLMVTDLERNDLGRVCEYGSVHVNEMRTIEEYKTVFQATSTVEGKLRADRDGFDLLQACFPSGSVTGCPKIRAIEIIEELEPHRRGIYTGALGYMNFNGNMDFNILIRTLLMTPRDLYFHTGGGIVADSIPEKEYEETLVKAKAINDCLKSLAGSRPYAFR